MSGAGVGAIIGVVVFVVVVVLLVDIICNCLDCTQTKPLKENSSFNPLEENTLYIPMDVVKTIEDMEREKPIQFNAQQLRTATDNFSFQLGSGGFGTVYKGVTSDGATVAVKVLNKSSYSRIEEQFIAEASTMGRTHHLNLVKLYGFCFEFSLVALVYEFMVNGSLDKYLSNEKKEVIRLKTLLEIALGTARGITYLHDECAQRIIHYDIKPENILLDSTFCAKVADFGLAKLCSREKSHITMVERRGTLGYTAPELWIPFQATHKCDVYSFGMLLFDIAGRRRNNGVTLTDIQQWFPLWAWNKYEMEQLDDLMMECEIEEEDDQKVVERMIKVAFCCAQYKPEDRPSMSFVVKMLEGALEIPEPINPFSNLVSGVGEEGASLFQTVWNIDASGSSSSEVVTSRSTDTPIMKKYEITRAGVIRDKFSFK